MNEAWNPCGTYASNELPPFCDSLIPKKSYSRSLDKNVDFYNKIAIDIVTETCFHYPTPYLSEKTMRPIRQRRMFLIVGAPGVLKLLKRHGFKTFSPFIDEAYDCIDDPHARINAISNEIERLCNMPIETVKEQMLLYQDVIEHNFKHLETQKDRDIANVKNLLGIKVDA